MIEIRVNDRLEWSIKYRIDLVVATEVLTNNEGVALQEIEKKMRLEMGLAKGKHFTTKTGREI